jgi:hypothetical protein
MLAHPSNGDGGVETPGEGNSDAFTGGEMSDDL